MHWMKGSTTSLPTAPASTGKMAMYHESYDEMTYVSDEEYEVVEEIVEEVVEEEEEEEIIEEVVETTDDEDGNSADYDSDPPPNPEDDVDSVATEDIDGFLLSLPNGDTRVSCISMGDFLTDYGSKYNVADFNSDDESEEDDEKSCVSALGASERWSNLNFGYGIDTSKRSLMADPQDPNSPDPQMDLSRRSLGGSDHSKLSRDGSYRLQRFTPLGMVPPIDEAHSPASSRSLIKKHPSQRKIAANNKIAHAAAATKNETTNSNDGDKTGTMGEGVLKSPNKTKKVKKAKMGGADVTASLNHMNSPNSTNSSTSHDEDGDVIASPLSKSERQRRVRKGHYTPNPVAAAARRLTSRGGKSSKEGGGTVGRKKLSSRHLGISHRSNLMSITEEMNASGDLATEDLPTKPKLSGKKPAAVSEANKDDTDAPWTPEAGNAPKIGTFGPKIATLSPLESPLASQTKIGSFAPQHQQMIASFPPESPNVKLTKIGSFGPKKNAVNQLESPTIGTANIGNSKIGTFAPRRNSIGHPESPPSTGKAKIGTFGPSNSSQNPQTVSQPPDCPASPIPNATACFAPSEDENNPPSSPHLSDSERRKVFSAFELGNSSMNGSSSGALSFDGNNSSSGIICSKSVYRRALSKSPSFRRRKVIRSASPTKNRNDKSENENSSLTGEATTPLRRKLKKTNSTTNVCEESVNLDPISPPIPSPTNDTATTTSTSQSSTSSHHRRSVRSTSPTRREKTTVLRRQLKSNNTNSNSNSNSDGFDADSSIRRRRSRLDRSTSPSRRGRLLENSSNDATATGDHNTTQQRLRGRGLSRSVSPSRRDRELNESEGDRSQRQQRRGSVRSTSPSLRRRLLDESSNDDSSQHRKQHRRRNSLNSPGAASSRQVRRGTLRSASPSRDRALGEPSNDSSHRHGLQRRRSLRSLSPTQRSKALDGSSNNDNPQQQQPQTRRRLVRSTSPLRRASELDGSKQTDTSQHRRQPRRRISAVRSASPTRGGRLAVSKNDNSQEIDSNSQRRRRRSTYVRSSSPTRGGRLAAGSSKGELSSSAHQPSRYRRLIQSVTSKTTTDRRQSRTSRSKRSSAPASDTATAAAAAAVIAATSASGGGTGRRISRFSDLLAKVSNHS